MKNLLKARKSGKKGFTLMEMLIVVAIIMYMSVQQDRFPPGFLPLLSILLFFRRLVGDFVRGVLVHEIVQRNAVQRRKLRQNGGFRFCPVHDLNIACSPGCVN